jgi:hypothetical protein
MDMEPNYEYARMFIFGRRTNERTFRSSHLPNLPVFSAYDVRKSYYRTILAGAAGFTYGCEPIRQVHRANDRVHLWVDEQMAVWSDCLAAPGSFQLELLASLLKERSYTTRVPAQELFIPFRQEGAWPDRLSIGLDFVGQQNSDPVSHISVAQCTEGNYVMAYVPVRQILTLDTSGMCSKRIRVSTYDPDECRLERTYELDNEGRVQLVPERDLDTFVVVDAI